MNPIRRLWKPWFVYRPSQLLGRVLGPAPATGTEHRLRTAWGMTLHVDPARDIGHSIVTTGVFDLAVSEVLARLVRPGARMVDAGANVGYMALLGAVASGPAGAVSAFEPHPDLFRLLQRNVNEAPAAARLAPVAIHEAALGERDGEAQLLLPPGFASNDGTARLVARPGASDRTVTVRVRSLDAVMGDEEVAVLKLDVEGHEPQVLAGAQQLLTRRRIRHVVFEDHDVARSDAVRRLRDAGYQLFALGWTMSRLRLEPLRAAGLARPYEAPSFVATVDPDGLQASCAESGWLALRPWLGRRAPAGEWD